MPKRFFKNKILNAFFGLAMAFVLGGFFWAYFILQPIGNSAILHFSDIDGITNLGGTGLIVFMGALGVLAILMNFFIAAEFAERDRFLAGFLGSITLVFAVLLFIAFAAIINVNV